MTLIGVIVRAAAVALMTATLLLPIADHHAAARLPEVALMLRPDGDPQSVFMHHHPDAHRGAPAPAPALAEPSLAGPVFAPAVPLPPGEPALAPQAAPAPTLLLAPPPGRPPPLAAESIPPGRRAPPPEPPPERAA